jgi:hypothetical protein
LSLPDEQEAGVHLKRPSRVLRAVDVGQYVLDPDDTFPEGFAL